MKWAFRPASEFHAVRDDWQRLCEKRYHSHPFLDSRFIESALQAFADEKVQIAIAEGDREGMALVRRRSRWVLESFCPSQLPMALFVWDDDVLDGGALRTIMSGAGGQLFGLLHYDALVHQPLDESTSLIESIDYAPTMNVSLSGDFESYWSERSKNLRRNISRYSNRAERDQLSPRLEEVTDAGDMAAAVKSYGEIESSGWKGQHGSAIHYDNEQGRFYTNLLEKFAVTRGARVFHLRFGDKIVASRMLVQAGQTAVILKTTYDEKYSRFAPGRVLLHLVLEQLFAENELRQVEFYTKASPDQLQWATGTRMIRHYNVYRRRSVAWLNEFSRRLSHKFRRREKS